MQKFNTINTFNTPIICYYTVVHRATLANAFYEQLTVRVDTSNIAFHQYIYCIST